MLIGNNRERYFSKTNIINAFLADIRKYEVSNSDDEERLFNEYSRSKSEKARNEIVLRNQRFVYSMAKIYAKNESEITDYVNVGNIGMIEAIDKFDPTLGFKFLSFAVLYIRREMNYYLTNTRNIVNRSNNAKYSSKIDRIKRDYFSENGFYPNESEIIDILHDKYGIDVKDKRDVSEVSMFYFNDTNEDGEETDDRNNLGMETASANTYEVQIKQDYEKSIVKSVLEILPESSRIMIMMLFGLGEYTSPLSPTIVGLKFNMSPEDVIKMKHNIIEYVRQNYKKKVAV